MHTNVKRAFFLQKFKNHSFFVFMIYLLQKVNHFLYVIDQSKCNAIKMQCKQCNATQ
jgi:hypothetical protein